MYLHIIRGAKLNAPLQKSAEELALKSCEGYGCPAQGDDSRQLRDRRFEVGGTPAFAAVEDVLRASFVAQKDGRRTSQDDLNGDDTIDQILTDAIMLNADGSKTKTTTLSLDQAPSPILFRKKSSQVLQRGGTFPRSALFNQAKGTSARIKSHAGEFVRLSSGWRCRLVLECWIERSEGRFW